MACPPSLKQRERRAAWLAEMEKLPGVFVPIRVRSNMREHWAVKAKRIAAERSAVNLMMYLNREWHSTLPVNVQFSRYGPKTMDDDNLRIALKGCRDEIAKLLRCDDGDLEKIVFEYRQEKAAFYGVRILISERKAG